MATIEWEDQPKTATIEWEDAPKKSFADQAKEAFTDYQLGGLQGMANIGNTLMRPVDYIAREAFGATGDNSLGLGRTDRREATKAGLASLADQMGIKYDPEGGWSKTGELASEIAGTAGAGGAVGKVLDTASKIVPRGANLLQRLAAAAETGGATAASPNAGRVSNALVRTAGAALGGGVGAGLINPDDAVTGAVIGGMFPVAGAVLGKAVTGIGNKIGPLSNARKAAGDIIGESDIPAAIRILDNAPATVTPEQALVGMNNPNIANLADITHGLSPELAKQYAQIVARQQAMRRAELVRLAGGGTQTAARDASKSMKDAISSVTVPAMEIEKSAANVGGTIGRQLQNEADRFAEAAASKVGDVRRISGAQQKAEEMAQLGYGTLASNIPREVGMPRISGKYSYPSELTQVAERGAQQAADASIPFGDAARFAQMQADSIAAHGLKPLDGNIIVNALERRIADPTVRGNQTSVKGLSHVADVIRQEIAAGGGIPDARALHDIRKTAVNDAAARLAAPGESAKATALRASGLLKEVTPLIDKAIETATGSKAWSNALKAHAEGMHLVERQRMGARALKMFDDTPESLVKLAEGNAPKEVEKIFGPKKYNIAKEMGSDYVPLRNVASQVKTDATLAGHTKGKVGTASRQAVIDALKRDSWISRIPSFLSRPLMIANTALRAGETRSNAKMMAMLADAMDNPKALSDLLKTVPLEQRSSLIRGFNNIAQSGGPAVAGGTIADLMRQE